MKLAVIGAGSWGTAIAITAARAGNSIRLWDRNPERAMLINKDRENKTYLPGFKLDDSILVTGDIFNALHESEMVITVTPSHSVRNVYEAMLPALNNEMIFVNATKGIEIESHMLMHQVINDVLSKKFNSGIRYASLSGPSFALETAKDLPTAVAVASCSTANSINVAETVQETFSSNRFRIYTNEDPVGTEICGAVKNVIAIAVGTVYGLGLGYNGAAALVTRGLAEIKRLALIMGGKSETVSGLAGMGDLVLTCFGELSRNRRVGYELGQGRKLQDILSDLHQTAEGVKTSKALHDLAIQLKVEMPIAQSVYQMLYEDKNPAELVDQLMDRPLKRE